MLGPKMLLPLTDRQRRLLPVVSTHYGMNSTAFVLAAIDAALATCADNDASARAVIQASELPSRLPLKEFV